SLSRRPLPSSTPFPYTTLFRSWNGLATRGTEAPNGNTPEHVRPMQRAVAFASNIRESQRVAKVLPSVTEELAEGSRYDLVVDARSEEHTSELQSRFDLVCRLLL